VQDFLEICLKSLHFILPIATILEHESTKLNPLNSDGEIFQKKFFVKKCFI